jgi:hypothetical protein
MMTDGRESYRYLSTQSNEASRYFGFVFEFEILVNIVWLCLAILEAYINGQDRVEALWRTLVGDKDTTTSVAH